MQTLVFGVYQALERFQTDRNILGILVLRKSVSTNFKLHKRKVPMKKNNMCFITLLGSLSYRKNFGTVFKGRRQRANRTAARGTTPMIKPEHLYCADCGKKIDLNYITAKDRSLQYSYRCGGYASKSKLLYSSFRSVDNVEALILSTVKRGFSRFVLNDEKKPLQRNCKALWNDKRSG